MSAPVMRAGQRGRPALRALAWAGLVIAAAGALLPASRHRLPARTGEPAPAAA